MEANGSGNSNMEASENALANLIGRLTGNKLLGSKTRR